MILDGVAVQALQKYCYHGMSCNRARRYSDIRSPILAMYKDGNPFHVGTSRYQ